jgi:hypothetical protein
VSQRKVVQGKPDVARQLPIGAIWQVAITYWRVDMPRLISLDCHCWPRSSSGSSPT